MTHQTHTEMVDSGIEWIGKIPKGWEVQKIGHQFFMMGGFSFKSEDYVDEGIPVIKMSEIDNGNIDVSNANFVAENDEYKSFLLKKGDLVIGLSGSLNNFAMIKESNEPCYLNQRVGRLTSKIGNTRFLFYIIQSKAYIEQIYLTATGTAQLNISNKQVCDMKYSFPPLTTQQAISSYLDNKTAQIEQAISLKTQQIELLREKRSALINHVVTKGLDPDVELVDSGIERIGKIPKGWEVRKLKYVCKNQNTKRIPLSSEERGLMTESVYDYYGASGVIDKVDNYLYDGEYILIGEDGANILSRSSEMAYIARGKFRVNNHAHILEVVGGDIEYICHQLELVDYSIYASGSAQPKLTQEKLMNISLVIPSEEEQQTIAIYLATKTAQIDNTISLVQQSIDLLIEYKQSLISHVVTGKVKVG